MTRVFAVCLTLALLAGCTPALRGTGDLGLVVERADGRLMVVETTGNTKLASVSGLGDLSHAALVYSRDQRFAFVFGRDGGLTKVDVLTGSIAGRVMQSGNSIGGAISQDGTLVAVANYTPGGIKVFDSGTLEQVADIPAMGADGKPSKVIGIADLSGKRFIYTLYDAGEIWIADLADLKSPRLTKYTNIGRLPYDALITGDGRWYLAGLFGEDGIALLDLWNPGKGVRRILDHYGKGKEALPVYKMPHLRGWAAAGDEIWLPAIGHHQVLVVDKGTWTEKTRIDVAGQPVFAMARPDGRQVWVNFALPDYSKVQVIDTQTKTVIKTLEPGLAILHMEFTPKGERVWLSARDSDKVVVYDTETLEPVAELPAAKPSGIFFTNRAHKTGL
ncbi:Heme d1 biosynthesis protein NirF [Paramagnetospirillum magnetotacticum MS-1]|uniref:Heme d1 biosynthesis protein NirF n=1 Tax=Paramagnetospirillum magnetotacticum MS-1 TaxID=272627 RepID=A0A0C2YXZ4_PARME|nr:cytochrome D1 domain-containing protein [Paramagnetospirillum magnetotacticum]KIL99973.1 Heme d1 biosynthesis protein NirF [Paramagnetospirillum magnetotacticum MS-1]